MAPMLCFWLEPTERQRQFLRRYSSYDRPMAERSCPNMPGEHSYHTARVRIEDAAVVRNERGRVVGVESASPARIKERGISEGLEPFLSDPRWPTACACGYLFDDDDNCQLFSEVIYDRTDTGEKTTLRDATPGAMWDAYWLDGWCRGPDGITLVVKLPGGHDWMVDGQADNCTDKDDWKNDDHHYCWVRHGDPRKVPTDLHVDKAGKTCAAGAGSIGVAGWHGFLHNGQLVEA